MAHFFLTSILVQKLACYFLNKETLSRKNCQVAKLVRVDDAARKTWQGIPMQVASNNIKPAPQKHVLLDKFSLTSFICSCVVVYPHDQINLPKKTYQVKLASVEPVLVNQRS